MCFSLKRSTFWYRLTSLWTREYCADTAATGSNFPACTTVSTFTSCQRFALIIFEFWTAECILIVSNSLTVYASY